MRLTAGAGRWRLRSRGHRGARRRRGGSGEQGSVLALIPAGFLVMILLAALAVDSAVAYQGQHQLHDALAAAANDVVTAGLSDQAFYSGGQVELDPAGVAAAACRSMEAQGLSSLHGLQLAVAVSGDSVRLTGRATVDAVFGRAVPGFGRRPVSSSADATVTPGPVSLPRNFPAPTPIACPGA